MNAKSFLPNTSTTEDLNLAPTTQEVATSNCNWLYRFDSDRSSERADRNKTRDGVIDLLFSTCDHLTTLNSNVTTHRTIAPPYSSP